MLIEIKILATCNFCLHWRYCISSLKFFLLHNYFDLQFAETVDIVIQKCKTIGQFNKEIHKKLALPTYNQFSLKYQDFELDISDPEISKLTIESAFNDEDGYTVECKFKEPGFFGKTLTLRNATNSELEVLIVYKVKEFNKERNIR